MSLRAKLGVIVAIYVIEGFPMGVYVQLWPVFFRRQEMPLAEIGLLSGLYLAWSAKVLWSPLVDRFGERRQWIAGSLCVMAVALLGVGASDGSHLHLGLWLVLAAFCLASATQDVAIDAYAIGLTERGEEGPVNSAKAVAYRIGMVVIASTGLLFLPRFIGWPGTFATSAAICLAMAAGVFGCPRVEVPRSSRREFWKPLRAWLGQPGATAALGFVLLYRVGDRAMGPMVVPFWVDVGMSDEEIAAVTGSLSLFATLGGAVLGGAIVARAGILRSLWVLGGLAVASNLGYAAAAARPEWGLPAVYAAIGVESFCAGLASAAFLSYLMSVCDKRHAAVQYALLTAIYALAGSLISLPSGWITERTGYAGYFALTAAYALPAFVLLPWARRWPGASGVP